MDRKTVIFDFDGTIVDTLEVALNIYNKIAPKYFCKTINKEDIENLKDSTPQEFVNYCGIAKFKLPFLLFHGKVILYKEMRNVKVIDGMDKALRKMKNSGLNLGIVTSNSNRNVNSFLKMNNLNHFFDFVQAGRNIFGKDNVIENTLKKYELEKKSVIYVGDEVRDVEAMKKMGIYMIAVTWGFNSRKALENVGADKVVDSPIELLEVMVS